MKNQTSLHPKVVIAITGAQGVGKSTLIDALQNEISRFGPCTSHKNLGASAALNGVPVGENANWLTILEFARLHIKREREIAEGIHILDRCFVDLLAYARQRCGTQAILLNMIEELTRSSLANYHLVVRIPIIPCLSQSRSANESTEFRFQIETSICKVLNDLTVDRVDLITTTPMKRVGEIIAALQKRALLG
jgi:predicted ATPase